MISDYPVHMRGSAKIVPQIFLKKYNLHNNIIYTDDSYIFCNYAAIFPQNVSIIFNTRLHGSRNREFYSNGTQRPTQRWQKCVPNDGDFVGK
jgi:hypothetical protein